MIKFKYNKNGELIAERNGKRVGTIVTTGDVIMKRLLEVKEREHQVHFPHERSRSRR